MTVKTFVVFKLMNFVKCTFMAQQNQVTKYRKAIELLV